MVNAPLFSVRESVVRAASAYVFSESLPKSRMLSLEPTPFISPSKLRLVTLSIKLTSYTNCMTLLEKPSAIFVPYADILVKVEDFFYRFSFEEVRKLSISHYKERF